MRFRRNGKQSVGSQSGAEKEETIVNISAGKETMRWKYKNEEEKVDGRKDSETGTSSGKRNRKHGLLSWIALTPPAL